MFSCRLFQPLQKGLYIKDGNEIQLCSRLKVAFINNLFNCQQEVMLNTCLNVLEDLELQYFAHFMELYC